MLYKCENDQKRWEILIKKCKEIKISRNMSVKIRLPWKRQIAWTKICHAKLLPDEF